MMPTTPHHAPSLPALPLKQVLVVDDTDDNLFLMRSLLEDTYAVLTAASGLDALAMANSSTPPDLILLDIMMPEMDGYEVLRRLRQHSATASIPVIFLTALSTIEEEQLGLDLGAVDYITKPISPPVLMARVQSHLERSHSVRRLQALSEKLSRYLAPQVYQSLFEGSQTAEIHTKRKQLTVFFSDIKDFTESTVRWQPEEITRLLNGYFSEMSRIAADFGGTLDKFIGDGMVIFFGDPHSRGVKEDALQCIKMALAMQASMATLQGLWPGSTPGAEFRIRIGINTGFCDVGNFGSDLRMEYTIIGSEVNLAARLEQAAPAGGILISAQTYALVKTDVDADPALEISAKGFARPIPAHSLRRLRSASAEETHGFQHELDRLQALFESATVSDSDRAAAAQALRQLANRLQADASPEALSAP